MVYVCHGRRILRQPLATSKIQYHRCIKIGLPEKAANWGDVFLGCLSLHSLTVARVSEKEKAPKIHPSSSERIFMHHECHMEAGRSSCELFENVVFFLHFWIWGEGLHFEIYRACNEQPKQEVLGGMKLGLHVKIKGVISALLSSRSGRQSPTTPFQSTPLPLLPSPSTLLDASRQ